MAEGHAKVLARRPKPTYFYEFLPDDIKQKLRERMRKWQKDNPERHKAYCRKWQRANPDKIKEYNERHARKLGFKDVNEYERYLYHRDKKVKV